MISGRGTFIAHPYIPFVMNESIFSIAEARGDPELRRIGKRMLAGEIGFAPFLSLRTGDESFLAFAPVGRTGWSVGVVFPEEEITEIQDELWQTQVLIGAVGAMLLLAVIASVASGIARPIRRLEQAARQVATGDLDTAVPERRGTDEVARLSRTFATMQLDLKQHILELQETTAAKERIDRELQIARSIQMSLVPKTFPPFPDRDDLDLHALLDPAREVGGDFYDFFFVTPTNLCLAIGDASEGRAGRPVHGRHAHPAQGAVASAAVRTTCSRGSTTSSPPTTTPACS